MVLSMKFEFNRRKSQHNKKKHGIDFIEAQKLWKSDTVLLRSKKLAEKRMLVIGKIEEKHWTAIITMRGRNADIVRIISVRRSRNEEKALHKKDKNECK